MRYIVGDIIIDILGQNDARWLGQENDIWGRFRRESTEAAEIFMNVLSPRSVDYQVACYKGENQQIKYVLRYGSDALLVEHNWTTGTMLSPVSPTGFIIFTNQLYYSRAVYHRMLQVHSSLVNWNGVGILFLGPSGIGKTTQAERWAQYRGAAIINGDIGFVQRTPRGYIAWGTPWHGSSPYCLNTSVPVKALVVLKQAPENRLRELTGFEKVREVSSSVFYPTWLGDGMELCTDTLNHLLTDLPVYRLDNRADEEAVHLLAAELDRIT